MIDALDKLNLRPGERRLVIGIAIVVFVVLNIWFVIPHFKDWGRVTGQYQSAVDTLTKFKTEIGKQPEYQKERDRLERGGEVLQPEERSVELRRIIQNQATQSNIVPEGLAELPRKGSTNEFFEEVPIRMGFRGVAEADLVDFLYNLSKDRSMIRVKDLSLRPDPSQQKLQGETTLVASYQKKSSAKIAAPTGPTGTRSSTTNSANPAPPAKPAGTKSAVTTKTPPPAKPAKPLPKSADVER